MTLAWMPQNESASAAFARSSERSCSSCCRRALDDRPAGDSRTPPAATQIDSIAANATVKRRRDRLMSGIRPPRRCGLPRNRSRRRYFRALLSGLLAGEARNVNGGDAVLNTITGLCRLGLCGFAVNLRLHKVRRLFQAAQHFDSRLARGPGDAEPQLELAILIDLGLNAGHMQVCGDDALQVGKHLSPGKSLAGNHRIQQVRAQAKLRVVRTPKKRFCFRLHAVELGDLLI